jgi:CubicO group peptidase (beta-lactamase class C family)
MPNHTSAAMIAIAAVLMPSLAEAACKDSDRPPTPTQVKWFATSDTTIALQWTVRKSDAVDINIEDVTTGKPAPGGGPGLFKGQSIFHEIKGLSENHTYKLTLYARTESGTEGCISAKPVVMTTKTAKKVDADACRQYTSRAAQQRKDMQGKGCPVDGPRWTTDPNAHFSFCINERLGGRTTDVSETKARDDAIQICSIDNAFRKWLTTNSITNASLVVMQNGQLIGQFGFGNRKSSTVVPIASLTKAITAMCIANLVDGGKLNYSDKVSDRLSSFFKSATIADARANNITIEHLLRHTSGLSFDPVVPPWAAGITNTASADETFAKAALAQNLDRVPGTGTNKYNNVNYALLGMIVNQVTGQTYEAYCKQSVLTPHRFSDVHIGAGIPAMGAFGGWEMSAEQYADFIYSHYSKMSAGADAFMKASFTAQYGLGVVLKSTSKGRNIWHFGNWPGGKAPFPPTTPSEFSSYFAFWDNELVVVALYDKAINNNQQAALDNALVKAAGK